MNSLELISKLAGDGSAHGRAALVNALTDLFLGAGSNCSPDLEKVFGEAVLKLLPALDQDAKADLAGRICDHPAAPAEVLIKLAHEPIEVASDVLERSRTLPAKDMAEMASSVPVEHLKVLACRTDLPANVVATLIERGDPDVWVALAENGGPVLSGEALSGFVQKAGSVPKAQTALIERDDLDDKTADQLAEVLTPANKLAVKEFPDGNPLKAALARKIAQARAVPPVVLQPEAQQKVEGLIAKIKSGNVPLDNAVQYLAKADKDPELVYVLAEFTQLKLDTMSQLVHAKTDKPLIAACKAIGLSADAFKYIVTMRARHLQFCGAELTASLQRYSAFQKENAGKTLQAMRDAERVETPDHTRDAETVHKDVPFAVKVRR